MKARSEFPRSEAALRRQTAAEAAGSLAGSYEEGEAGRLTMPAPAPKTSRASMGVGAASWPAVEAMLDALNEFAVPGCCAAASGKAAAKPNIEKALEDVAAEAYALLERYYALAFEGKKASERAAHAALYLISRLPQIRERALWNIFASLKDPAVWDSFVQRGLQRREELARLDLLAEVDRSIRTRNRGLYRDFLRQHGFEGAYEYHLRLVKLAYPGWRALVLHDFAHALAKGGEALDGQICAEPTPILPRVISQRAATLYQTDFHPECEIGDANFVEHPNRGITTGQTGKIGIGCVLYPCTLGGVTDKVKPRHPSIGDFVLIGTDVGVFGQVEVGDETVLGANSEIYGFVRLGKGVKIGSSVVVRTVRGSAGRPGKLIIEDGVTIADETLVVNDQPSDLVIPAHSAIPAHAYIVNDGFGRPKIV